MFKRVLIEGTLFILTILSYVLYLFLNKSNTDLDFFLSYVLFIGLILPLAHLFGILIYQVINKGYISSKYDSLMTYFIILINGFVYIITKYTLANVFNNIKYLMWIIPIIIYITLIITGIIMEHKDKEKRKSLRLKVKNN